MGGLVAELKFWDGPESLRFVIGQLRGRLTWRDSYGVALVLSRNAGFDDVLKSAREHIPTAEGFVAGSLQAKSAHHSTARVTIPSDTTRRATIHVLVFNLYTPDAGKRVTKRQTSKS